MNWKRMTMAGRPRSRKRGRKGVETSLAEYTAVLTRAVLTAYERKAVEARDAGKTLPVAFWNGFGDAFARVRLAERAVAKERENADEDKR